MKIGGSVHVQTSRLAHAVGLTFVLLSGCSYRPLGINGNGNGNGADMAEAGGSADFSAAPIDLGSAAWTAQPSGTTRWLHGVWGSSASDVYVVGASGTILHSTGDGNWHAQASGTMKDLNGIWGSSATDLYIAGDGVVLRSAGDGSWRSETPPSAAYQAVWGSGPGDVYIAGVIAISHSTGDGSWTTTPPSAVTRGYFGLGGTSASDVWAVGGNATGAMGQGTGGCEHYDGSWSWSALTNLENLKGIAFTSRSAFIVGNGGQIWANPGSGWSLETSHALNDLNGVWAAADGTLFAVGGSGTIVTSMGDATWSAQATPSALPLAGVWGANAHDVYAVGAAGIIYHRP